MHLRDAMITTQTFQVQDKAEMEAISLALDLLAQQRYQEAIEVLIRRHDLLTKEPTLIPYNQRAA
jgi:hypothetical protein